ncbi:MAG: hypothetical protein KAU17_15855 [Spirochaetales bacterium]|nr:hypothetical protein [Spirochaetales bacterium]
MAYVHPIVESIKYIAFVDGRPIGCSGWSSPAWYIKSRDQFVGTTYKASNWIFLGKTKGLGRLSKTGSVERCDKPAER